MLEIFEADRQDHLHDPIMGPGLDYDMGRARKPARLWWGEGEWCILDGGRKVRTGLGAGERAAAEDRLVSYITSRQVDEKPTKRRRARDVSAAEVLSRYLTQKTADEKTSVARPAALAGRIERLLDYWGEMTLDAIDEDACAQFAAFVGSDSAARRMLEDFRAACRAYRKAGYLGEEVLFSMPEKSASREDWLTSEEAVALVRTAWSHRLIQRERDTARWHRRHVAKFIITAIATCSRSSRIYEAGYVAEPGRPFVDLDRGLFYRSAPGAKKFKNKRSPTIPISSRLLATMRRWHARGDRYVVQYGGRAADPRKGFQSALEAARERYPTLFLRDDGTPKRIVRHSLRHTGITWLALAGVAPYEITKFAGISMAVFEGVYSHFSPKAMAGVEGAQGKRARPTTLARPAQLLLPPPEAYEAVVFEDAAE